MLVSVWSFISVCPATLTVQNLALALLRLDRRHVARRIEQAELAAAVEALVLAQLVGMDAERGGLLRYDERLLARLLRLLFVYMRWNDETIDAC